MNKNDLQMSMIDRQPHEIEITSRIGDTYRNPIIRLSYAT